MIFRQLFDRTSCTYTYLIADHASRKAVLIDPVREQVDRDLLLVRELGVDLTMVLDTHVHADHVTGAGEIRKRLNVRTAIAREGGPLCADVPLDDGAIIPIGGALQLRALATPGHTAGCMCYIVERDGVADRMITGDCLLVRGCGRTDFQAGSAHAMFASVRNVLFAFPDETLVFPGHDYLGATASTIGEEKQHNPRLNLAISRDEFLVIMEHLHLAPPANIAVALPANRACGNAPIRPEQQDPTR